MKTLLNLFILLGAFVNYWRPPPPPSFPSHQSFVWNNIPHIHYETHLEPWLHIQRMPSWPIAVVSGQSLMSLSNIWPCLKQTRWSQMLEYLQPWLDSELPMFVTQSRGEQGGFIKPLSYIYKLHYQSHKKLCT